jgi:PAS domain S-box-containing protein
MTDAHDPLYRDLAERMQDVVTVTDREGRFLYVSPSAATMTGNSPADLLGRSSCDMLAHPDDERLLGQAAQQAMSGTTTLVTWRCRRKSGGFVWLESRVSRLPDEPSGAVRLLGVSRDIESRLTTEAALREAETSMRALVERAALGIFRVTRSGRFLDVNDALVNMLGYPNAQALRDADMIRDILCDDRDRERWSADAEGDHMSDWYEQTWRRLDGAQIQMRLAVRTARDAYGRPQYYEAICENVTERRRRDEILRRGDRMSTLSRTLAGVAHEINNPLTAIVGFTQILLKGERAPEDRRALETMLSEGRRAARIVKDLLLIATRQESLLGEIVHVNDVARYIMDTQRYAMETHGIRTQLHLAADNPAIHGDPAQIEQVLLHLLGNARQALIEQMERMRARGATPAHSWTPEVALRISSEASFVGIEIADNGPGISAADLPHIWDPFWTSREEGQGSGLGLSVVHGIVGSHGGTIDVDTSVGRGTRFRLTLPRYVAEVQKAEEAAEAATALGNRLKKQALRPLDLLIVDDEEVLRNLLMRFFSARGHAVVAAAEGTQAIRLAEQSSFDVVICDLRMPGMDGRDVIRRLRLLPSCARTRFVLATGDTSTSLDRLREEGTQIDALVTKPYNVDAMLAIVEGNNDAA